jgi:hypothetical protein
MKSRPILWPKHLHLKAAWQLWMTSPPGNCGARVQPSVGSQTLDERARLVWPSRVGRPEDPNRGGKFSIRLLLAPSLA